MGNKQKFIEMEVSRGDYVFIGYDPYYVAIIPEKLFDKFFNEDNGFEKEEIEKIKTLNNGDTSCIELEFSMVVKIK